MSRVLIVEDQAAVSQALTVLLEIHGIACEAAAGPEEALARVHAGGIGLVVQDMNFRPGETSGEEGIALFRRIRRADPDLPVLVLTAWTSLETAVAIAKEGASDYLAKPWDDTKLLTSVRNLLRMRELIVENDRVRGERARAREDLASRYDLCGLLYESEAMHRVVSLAVQVASADVPVLITGSNGTGKEKVAEIVQANSRRRANPFIKVNVGALPDELLESELFGAEAGAYTGSKKRRVGRFGAAHGGTLFLDEIGNLSPAGQMKVLRVLQSGEFEPLGSSETMKVDVRILAATNVDLEDALAAGRFREDLYFRLNVIQIDVPPLRDRPDDILPLAECFLGRFATSAAPRPSLSRAAREALRAHRWPGNVRELMNATHRAALIGAGPELTPEDLGLGAASRGWGVRSGESSDSDARIRQGRDEGSEAGSGSTESSAPERGLAGDDRAERARIEEALLAAHGQVSEAASRLGLSRQALYRRMDRLGIVLERRPRG